MFGRNDGKFVNIHYLRERSLFTMSEHNKYIYKLDNGRLLERNNHHSWPRILKKEQEVQLSQRDRAMPLSSLSMSDN